MPPSPKSGMAYKAPNPAEAAQKSRVLGAPGAANATEAAELTPIELQEMQGNDFINDMIKGGSTESAQEASIANLPLPPEVRWHLLASTDIQDLATLIYSQCTPSETVTKEMLAIGSVYFNRMQQTMAHPEDQREFGAPSFEGMLFQLQKMMPVYYRGDRQASFHHAARFGGDLGSSADVKTAVASVQAADQIYSGVNPFPEKYMYMDMAGNSPNPDRTDFQTHAQYGKLHFWAMKSDNTSGAEEAVQASQTLLNSSSAAEPIV